VFGVVLADPRSNPPQGHWCDAQAYLRDHVDVRTIPVPNRYPDGLAEAIDLANELRRGDRVADPGSGHRGDAAQSRRGLAPARAAFMSARLPSNWRHCRRASPSCTFIGITFGRRTDGGSLVQRAVSRALGGLDGRFSWLDGVSKRISGFLSQAW
jgi:hypothetical protein